MPAVDAFLVEVAAVDTFLVEVAAAAAALSSAVKRWLGITPCSSLALLRDERRVTSSPSYVPPTCYFNTNTFC